MATYETGPYGEFETYPSYRSPFLIAQTANALSASTPLNATIELSVAPSSIKRLSIFLER